MGVIGEVITSWYGKLLLPKDFVWYFRKAIYAFPWRCMGLTRIWWDHYVWSHGRNCQIKVRCDIDMLFALLTPLSLQWRHNGQDGVSNHQPHDCLLNGFFLRRSKKTSKFRVTGLCGEFTGHRWIPRRKTSNAENFPFDDVIMVRGYHRSPVDSLTKGSGTHNFVVFFVVSPNKQSKYRWFDTLLRLCDVRVMCCNKIVCAK